MNGITILNTYANTSSPSWVVAIALCGATVVMVGVILFLVSKTYSQMIFGIVFSVIGFIAVIGGYIFAEKNVVETARYECIVSDEVNPNDLYEQYNVIEKRGEIWVLEEKDNDE